LCRSLRISGELPAPIEEIAFENGRISNFKGLMTVTLDWVILHTVVHHSSTSTYMPNFIWHVCRGQTDVRTYIWDPLYQVNSEEST